MWHKYLLWLWQDRNIFRIYYHNIFSPGTCDFFFRKKNHLKTFMPRSFQLPKASDQLIGLIKWFNEFFSRSSLVNGEIIAAKCFPKQLWEFLMFYLPTRSGDYTYILPISNAKSPLNHWPSDCVSNFDEFLSLFAFNSRVCLATRRMSNIALIPNNDQILGLIIGIPQCFTQFSDEIRKK